ncbi:MAG: aldehyde ferredoxin oxidoreductase N-terminal domain-containing protein, partial [Chloroflexota bacterium]
MTSYVYAGKILQGDLSTSQQSIRPITESEVRTYLLGSGLAAKIYLDWIQENGIVDPLDPRNPLIILNGLLSGTFSPTG